MKLKKTSFLCGAGMALACLSLPAALPDPVGGVITITNDVTVSTSAEAATLADATGLVLNEGKTLTYTCADALALSAKVTGTGTFKATSAGKVTLTGDNELTSPGHFEFSGTALHLGHFNALGGAGAGTAIYDSTAAFSVTFVNNCFTNNTPLSLSNGESKIGSCSATDYFVQNADLRLNNHIRFQNNFEMCHGTLNHTDGGQRWWYQDGTGKVRLTGDTETNHAAGQIIYFSNLEIGGKSFRSSGGIKTDSTHNITMMKDYILTEDTYFAPYAQSGYVPGTYYNLNGHSQNIAFLGAQSTGNYAGIRSVAGPCTLATVTTVTGTQYAPYVIQDAISYSNGCNKVHTFKQVHTSTGDLWVTKGGVTFLANGTTGGGWSGNNVTVSGAGVLDCQSVDSLKTGKHVLTVRDGGTLKISSGVTLKVQTATFDTVTLEPATTYTVAQLKELTKAENVTVDGEGSIQTASKSIPGTWEGWPEVGAATKWTVPDGATATIAEADIPKVEQLEEIETGVGSEITFAVSGKTLSLNAKLSGGVLVRVTNAGKLVINADNSGLVSPGGFYVEGTTTIVSNRWGLGTEKTAPAVFYPKATYTSNYSTLWFGGEAKTNDAPIDAYYGMHIGYQDTSVTFVQRGKIAQTYGSASPSNRRLYFYNNFALATNVVLAAGDIGSEGGELRVEKGASIPSFSGIFGGGALAVAGKITGGFSLEQCIRYIRCEADDCFSNSFVSMYDSSSSSFCFNLNGHSQTLTYLQGKSYWNSNQQTIRFQSATPATLTLNSSKVKDGQSAWWAKGAIRFDGQVSVVKDNVSTQLVGCATSATTGTLTINNGAIQLDRNAKWVGGNVILNGGALIVNATAGTNTFNVAGRRSEVELVVTGGKLHLPSATSAPSVKRVKVNGAYVERGTYDKTNCDWITGAGSLTVNRGGSHGLAILIK